MLENFLGREARRETLGIFIPTIIKKRRRNITKSREKHALKIILV